MPPKILVISGPTASGKTRLAVEPQDFTPEDLNKVREYVVFLEYQKQKKQ